MSDCQAAAATDTAAAQDQPASAADPGRLSFSKALITAANENSSSHTSKLCRREKKRKLKYFLSCVVLAGEHALRDDPGLPPQHPTPSGDL